MSDTPRVTVETIRLGADRLSGAEVRQLTSSPTIDSNIYGEIPYMDPSSRWVIFLRSPDTWRTGEVWRADLQRGWLEPVCDRVPDLRAVTQSPDQRYFYCRRAFKGNRWELLRTEVATLEQTTFVLDGAPQPRSLATAGADNRTYVYATKLEDGDFGIVRCDLELGEWEVIHTGHDICNAHPQLEPGQGQVCLIQHNRGCEIDERGRIVHLVGPEGATLYLIDVASGEKTELPVGKPYTAPCQGHQCWIGDTGEVLLTISGPDLATVLEHGNLLRIRPGDVAARAVAVGFNFVHPNASRDGRFFVSDTRTPDGVLLVVGSIRTGRTRVLCDSRATLSAPQYTHPHPYFSPDCRWVIFNSDGSGLPNVCAARVPDGMLEELDC
ncbi:MAG TPA: hypothetical protein VM283_04265 [Armatimonadota bacterium]|nr:hypothetical protein [Armatimonadota bacterium]